MTNLPIVWTEYFRYRCRVRDFDLATVEDIVRYSTERYHDTATGRLIAVGRHDVRLVMVAYEQEDTSLTPITIHATSRPQINSRIRSGRFTNE
jgi:hypothetical protein